MNFDWHHEHSNFSSCHFDALLGTHPRPKHVGIWV